MTLISLRGRDGTRSAVQPAQAAPLCPSPCKAVCAGTWQLERTLIPLSHASGCHQGPLRPLLSSGDPVTLDPCTSQLAPCTHAPLQEGLQPGCRLQAGRRDRACGVGWGCSGSGHTPSPPISSSLLFSLSTPSQQRPKVAGSTRRPHSHQTPLSTRTRPLLSLSTILARGPSFLFARPDNPLALDPSPAHALLPIRPVLDTDPTATHHSTPPTAPTCFSVCQFAFANWSCNEQIRVTRRQNELCAFGKSCR